MNALLRVAFAVVVLGGCAARAQTLPGGPVVVSSASQSSTSDVNVTLKAGACPTPSLNFTGDTSTGIYDANVTTHEMAFCVNGSAVAGFSTAGLYIGTLTNDTGRIPIGIVEAPVGEDATHETLIVRANNTAFDSAQIVAQNSSGEELRMGLEGPATGGTFWGNARAHLETINAASSKLGVGTNSAQDFFFVTSATERMRLLADGTLIKGATTNATGRTTPWLVVSADGGDYSLVAENTNAANGAFLDVMNDQGDDSYFGITGSTGFSVLGASRARTLVLVSRSPNGLALGTTNAKAITLSTNATERVYVESDGGLDLKEQTAPATQSGRSVLYADSSAHVGELSNNGDTFEPISRDVSSYTTSAISATSTSYQDVITIALSASSKYACEVALVYSESVAADGIKIRINPGATSATTDAISGELYDTDSATGGGALHTSGATSDVGSAGTIVELSDTNTTSGHAVFHYNVNTSAALTWKLQMAQQSHTTGTASVKPGATATCHHL